VGLLQYMQVNRLLRDPKQVTTYPLHNYPVFLRVMIDIFQSI
jgi:hypothetical protein